MNNTIEKPLIPNLNGINDVLTDLQTRGFFYLFKLKDEYISYKDYNIAFEEFDILEVHTLETLPAAGKYFLFAIKCDKFNIKGIVITSLDTYANNFFNNCISKLLNCGQLIFKYHTANYISEPVIKIEPAICESLNDLLLMQYLS
jgi:hypothetical protein